jgi:hypothetical protein
MMSFLNFLEREGSSRREFLNFAGYQLLGLEVRQMRKVFHRFERHARFCGYDNQTALNWNHDYHEEIVAYNGVAHSAEVQRPGSHRPLEKSEISYELRLARVIQLFVSQLADDHTLSVVHVSKVAHSLIQTEDKIFQLQTVSEFQAIE